MRDWGWWVSSEQERNPIWARRTVRLPTSTLVQMGCLVWPALNSWNNIHARRWMEGGLDFENALRMLLHEKLLELPCLICSALPRTGLARKLLWDVFLVLSNYFKWLNWQTVLWLQFYNSQTQAPFPVSNLLPKSLSLGLNRIANETV